MAFTLTDKTFAGQQADASYRESDQPGLRAIAAAIIFAGLTISESLDKLASSTGR